MGYDAEVPAAATHQGGFTGAQALVSDDAECIDRVLRGDIERFSELIARHQRHVLKIVQGHVPADRVPEVAHDVFVRAYTGLSQYAGTVPFEHWLSRLSVCGWYDFLRALRPSRRNRRRLSRSWRAGLLNCRGWGCNTNRMWIGSSTRECRN